MSVRIVDLREITRPIGSSIRNAYIDFTKMTTSLVAIVTDAVRDGQRASSAMASTPTAATARAGSSASVSPRVCSKPIQPPCSTPREKTWTPTASGRC
jgi:hypothetical protein